MSSPGRRPVSIRNSSERVHPTVDNHRRGVSRLDRESLGQIDSRQFGGGSPIHGLWLRVHWSTFAVPERALRAVDLLRGLGRVGSTDHDHC